MRPATFRWERGTVSGAWHEPVTEPWTALALTHGAGTDMDRPLLAGVAGGLAERGIAVVRFNLPYREAGRRAPSSRRDDEACWRAVTAEVGRAFPRPFIGGMSYGGRIASHVVADGTEAGGLVLVGYPLHPAGKPDRLRTGHLDLIEAPTLFLSGTRDALARIDLLRETVASLPGAELVEIEGADHSFRVRGRSEEDVGAELVGAIEAFLRRCVGRPTT